MAEHRENAEHQMDLIDVGREKPKRGRRAKVNDQPQTTAQQLGSLIKSARDIMRKDKGLSGDLDRLPMLTWIMFLKFLDDMEQIRAQEAKLEGKRYRPAIEKPYRWRDWAAREDGITGPELIAFVNQEEAVRPDGTKGDGLFAYLRGLQSANGRDRRDVIAAVFRGVINRMVNGYLLRDVINKVNGIHFNSSEEIHTLGNLYESMLREMRDAAGDSGEFYTPRPVVRFMVEVMNPRLGETVLDPACGTGGFLVESYSHLENQCKTVEHRKTLQEETIFGQEAKPLPYLLGQMNLLLHGLEYPQIDDGNSLAVPINEIGDKDRVDVILTNPPFGGEEEAGIKSNFPEDKQTSETALLFLQLIMRKLKRRHGGGKGGRGAVVVPNGTLFGDGVCARIKEDLLKNFNLHTIVRLPNGVFAPYTSIPTNLLFFDRSGPTKTIWYYEIPLPDGRKNYTKTKPMQFEEFADCIQWFHPIAKRAGNDHAWRVNFERIRDEAIAKATPHWRAADAAADRAKNTEKKLRDFTKQVQQLREQLDAAPPRAKERRHLQMELSELGIRHAELLDEAKELRQKERDERARGDSIYWPIYNLDLKNPNSTDALEHLPPEKLADDILAKERRILEIVGEIKATLKETSR